MAERKNILLRLDPAVHDALAKWAADEMRSTNAGRPAANAGGSASADGDGSASDGSDD
jgi:hypothetical protein